MPRPSHQRPAGYPVLPTPEPPSSSGRWIGWGVYAFLALVGFCFGVWVGNQRPAKATTEKTTEVARAVPTGKESPPPADKPKPADKLTPEPAPKTDLPTPTPPKTTELTTPEPKAPAPKPPEPKKPEPKKPEPKPAAAKEVSFAKVIVPIFRSKCLNCHGAVGNPKGGLDLRMVAAIMKGGDSGAGVKPGDLKGSPVWVSIDDGSMPPNGKDPLTAAEKKLVEDWILSGAKP